MVKYMAVAVAVAVAVSGGGAVAVAVAVAVAGLTKRFFNHIQKDFLINVWGYPVLTPMSEHVGAVLFCTFFFSSAPCGTAPSSPFQKNGGCPFVSVERLSTGGNPRH